MEYKILGVSKDGKDIAIKRPYRYSARYCQPQNDPGAKAEETFKVKYGLINRADPPFYAAYCEDKGKSRLHEKIKTDHWLELLQNCLRRNSTVGHRNMCQLLLIIA